MNKYAVAASELILIFPAVLFMAALFVRNVQPPHFEPAESARHIVNWYAARPRIGLWGLLIALPLTVLVTGCARLVTEWTEQSGLRQAARQALTVLRAHLATLLVAGATLTALGVLGIVALHVVSD